jgi:hypothetical protein
LKLKKQQSGDSHAHIAFHTTSNSHVIRKASVVGNGVDAMAKGQPDVENSLGYASPPSHLSLHKNYS